MEKLQLLRQLKLFVGVPEDQLAKLSDFLIQETRKDGETVFHEGTPGDALYFVAAGRVRIAKHLPRAEGGQELKDLAILSAGDCFGEMALIESVQRSADAIVSGDAVLLKLERKDLDRWLRAHPLLALGFFNRLVQTLSGRLRRSSAELAMLFDLSRMLLENFESTRELVARVFERIVPHLEGDWAAGAWVYNEFNDEMDLAASRGGFESVPAEVKAAAQEGKSGWLDASTYAVAFPGSKRPRGAFLLRRAAPPTEEERVELDRALTTTALLIATALENIAYRAEEGFRSRLNTVKTTRI
ncbi:MAG: cyclic nucleotide-binding domain-containing protein [Elusimicrobiota bacterium]|jgi:CRP-like cAMP-binding protein